MRSDRSVAVVVVCVIFPVIASLTVCLRLYSQTLKGNRVSADDYIILSGLVVALGSCAMMVYGAFDGGLGWPAQDIVGPTALVNRSILFSVQLLWAASITLVRIGLLVFYRRIFVMRSFQMANDVLIGINVAWVVTVFLGTIFGFSWKTPPENKIDYPVWLIVNGVLDMVLDIVTLCMPSFVIRTLQMSMKRRFMLVGVFWLGLFCIIASIVRLVYHIQLDMSGPGSRQALTAGYYCSLWSVIEPCTSIIAACLPTYGPLFREGRGFRMLFRSLASKLSLTSNSSQSQNAASSIHGTDQKTHKIDIQASSPRIDDKAACADEDEAQTWFTAGDR